MGDPPSPFVNRFGRSLLVLLDITADHNEMRLFIARLKYSPVLSPGTSGKWDQAITTRQSDRGPAAIIGEHVLHDQMLSLVHGGP